MSTDLNVLILEDKSSDVELMLHQLRRAGFSPTWQQVETRAEFLAHLSPTLDVILTDYSLPQFDAPSALELLRQSKLDIPAIIVSGTIGEELAVSTIKQGAADYLLKDRLARLGPAVKRVLEEKQLRDETQRFQEALQESEELHRITLSNISEAVFITNDDGAFTYICPNIEIAWGYTVEEFEAFDNIFQLLGPGLFSIDELEAKKEIKNIEQEITDKAGNRLSLLITVKRVAIRGGTILYTCRDITERKQAQQAQQRQLNELKVLHAVATTSARATDEDILIERVTEIIGQSLYPNNFGVALVDDADGGLHPHPSYQGLGSKVNNKLLNWSAESVTGRVAATGQPWRIADVSTEPAYVDTQAGIRSELCVPLKINERVIGVVNAESKQPNAFREADERLLVTVAGQLATAIDRIRLFKTTQHQLERLAALHEIDMAITSSLDLTTTLNLLLQQVTAQLNLDAAAVLLLNDQTQMLEHAADHGFREKPIEQMELPLGRSYAGRAVEEQQVVYEPNLSETDDFFRASLIAQEAFVTYYGVPLVSKGKAEGVLELFHRTPHQSDPEWFDFLQSLAAQAAIAIENTRLFEETRRLLEQTQFHVRQIQQIMDTVSEGLVLIDAGHRIIVANPTARQYLALLGEAQEGDQLTHLAERPLDELLSPPAEGLRHEIEYSGPPDQVFEVETQSMQTGPQAGGWLLDIREVTQEREVQQRAQQQERLAAVGQLAAGIAHDFNNILTGIMGLAELARFYPETATSTEETLDGIIQQSQRAATLIRQLLDFSRQSITEMQPVELEPLVKDALKLLKRTIPEDVHIRLEVAPDQEHYPIKGNPVQIQQVLTNLALNAQQAMPEGGLLNMRLFYFQLKPEDTPPAPEMSPGDWVALAISDNGVGMSPEVVSFIFEPFFTTKPVGQGTGLGLAQVHGIVKQHGGEIDVVSEPEQGTTFTLYFPALKSSQNKTLEGSTDTVPFGSEETILLVEDESSVRYITRNILVSLGYQVLSAKNGVEALDVYEQHSSQIVLVLTDLTMPEMGGAALAQILREKDPDLKVIAMTGYPLEKETKEALSQGIVAWLQKPLSIKPLARMLYNILKE